jgi:hypothetical protein
MRFFIKVNLLLLILVQLVSCSILSSSLILDDQEKIKYSQEANVLKESRSTFATADFLFYSNWQYTGLWGDLESWKTSEKLFRNICLDYWKVKPESVHEITHDRGSALLSFLKGYQGKMLIIYFSSHQTSKGMLVMHDGSYLPIGKFAAVLKEMNSKVLLIFDTCYAESLKKHLNQSNISVIYTGPTNQEIYDFRPRGQKPSINAMCIDTLKFTKAVWGMDIPSASPFGFYFLSAFRNSYEGATFGQLVKATMALNEEMIKVSGMGRYPSFTFDDPAGFSSIRVR